MAIRSTTDSDTKDLRQLILTNELGDRMLNMVAPIYDQSAIALHLFQAIGTALSKELDFVNGDLIAQMYPQTATWGLKYWEDAYGIITDESKSLDQRRKYLMSVMYQKYPLTPKRIEQLVTGVTGLDCEVTENYQPNTFLVTIRGYVGNMQPVKDRLNRKSPAHLNYVIELRDLENVTLDTFSVVAVSPSMAETIGIDVQEYFNLETLSIASDSYPVVVSAANVTENIYEIEVIDE